MKHRRSALTLLAVTLIAASTADFQSSPARRTVTETRDWGQWAGPFRDRLVPSMMRDFGERYLYQPANASLPPPAKGERRVVFIGDSITDKWDLADAFPGRPYVNRGIGAQVTAQMLVRFEQDVVALHPAAVVILGGTNDLTGFLQVETPESIVANISAMADIADAHGIRVVLCSLLPVNDYTENARHVVSERPPASLRKINAALGELARQRGYTYADYAGPLTDARGLLGADYTGDGLHPNAAGYSVMRPVATAAIGHALGMVSGSARR